MSEQPPGFFPMTIAQKSGHCMPGLKSKVYRSIIPSPDRWDEANYRFLRVVSGNEVGSSVVVQRASTSIIDGAGNLKSATDLGNAIFFKIKRLDRKF